MKRWRKIIDYAVLAGLAATVLMCSGCAGIENPDTEAGLSAEAYSRKPLTENQEQILRSCGMTNRKIEEMKEEGVPELTEEFVTAAEIMLEKMQERYGMSFMVLGGTIPDWSSADFTFMLCAADGELAGKPFGAAYRLESGGERHLYEEFYALKRRTEVQKDVQNIADQLGTEIRIIAYAEGEIGEDVLPASEEAMQSVRIDILGFMPKETRTEFIQSAAESLYEEIKTYEVRDYRVYRVRHNSALGRLTDYESIGEVFPMGIPEATDYLCKKGENNE